MNFFLLISVVFIYLSFASINMYKKIDFKDQVLPLNANIIYVLIALSWLILPVFCYVKYFEISWYWSIPLNFLGTLLTLTVFFTSYVKFFGYKKLKFSLTQGGYVKQNMFMVDAIITFVLAIASLMLGLV